jgi:hypothetical protein
MPPRVTIEDVTADDVEIDTEKPPASTSWRRQFVADAARYMLEGGSYGFDAACPSLSRRLTIHELRAWKEVCLEAATYEDKLLRVSAVYQALLCGVLSYCFDGDFWETFGYVDTPCPNYLYDTHTVFDYLIDAINIVRVQYCLGTVDEVGLCWSSAWSASLVRNARYMRPVNAQIRVTRVFNQLIVHPGTRSGYLELVQSQLWKWKRGMPAVLCGCIGSFLRPRFAERRPVPLLPIRSSVAPPIPATIVLFTPGPNSKRPRAPPPSPSDPVVTAASTAILRPAKRQRQTSVAADDEVLSAAHTPLLASPPPARLACAPRQLFGKL